MKSSGGSIGRDRALLAAVMALLLAGLGWAQNGLSPKEFVEQASAKGMAEVETGRLAMEKSKNEEVRQFATRMVQDHEAANRKLKTLASQKNMSASSEEARLMNEAKGAMLKMRDESFDKAYMESQVKAHEQTIELYQRASTELTDPELKALAQESLPLLQQHLQMARELDAKLQGR